MLGLKLINVSKRTRDDHWGCWIVAGCVKGHFIAWDSRSQMIYSALFRWTETGTFKFLIQTKGDVWAIMIKYQTLLIRTLSRCKFPFVNVSKKTRCRKNSSACLMLVCGLPVSQDSILIDLSHSYCANQFGKYCHSWLYLKRSKQSNLLLIFTVVSQRIRVSAIYRHAYVIKMVADALMPSWYKTISNLRAYSAMTVMSHELYYATCISRYKHKK